MEAKTDRRIRKTRAQLRAGLARLMSTKSIKEITVKELVEEVDINRSTFYLHYTDIYQMLESIEAELMQEIMEAMEALPLDFSQERGTYSFITRMFSILKENEDICCALLGPNGDMAFVSKAETIVAETILKGITDKFPKDIQNITYAYAFCLNGCIGLIKTWLANPEASSPEAMAQLAYQFVENTAHYYLEQCKEKESASLS